MLHTPLASQHAPVGIVHGFVGAQVFPTTPNVLGSAHAAGSVSVHTPAVEQHGPTLAVHAPGEHTDPTPRKVLVPPHAAGVTFAVHTPRFEQHAPVIVVHGLGLHVEPSPRNVPVQPLPVVTVQALGLALLQHAPWHAFGVHTVPTPKNRFGPTHASAVVVEHTPADVQHAPVCALDSRAAVIITATAIAASTAPLRNQFNSMCLSLLRCETAPTSRLHDPPPRPRPATRAPQTTELPARFTHPHRASV